MASLSTILSNRGSSLPLPPVAETNLEAGQTFLFVPNHYTSGINTFTWTAAASGTAIIEIWGASGSGGRMCCCGGGIPGNPGAYAKKTITVSNGSTVCGTVGLACANDTLCYRGRSENTCICYNAATSGVVCAEGGYGGFGLCNGGSVAHYCCFIGCGFCFTNCGSGGCGWICNYGGPNSVLPAAATGGDVNCPGGISCVCFSICDPINYCYHHFEIATSPGVFSKQGSYFTFQAATSNYNFGVDYQAFIAGLNALSTSPRMGKPWSTCWSSNNPCGCYDSAGCFGVLPHGVPGLSGFPCASVRDNGLRGGPGAVRIQFIGS